MACFQPIDAWQALGSGADKRLKFSKASNCRYLQIPCGRCIGCRLVRQRMWAIRCVHESQMHRQNSFVTLTYENTGPSLVPMDFTRFMYRVRQRLGSTRFYACGEYGELTQRPHFHALLFGRTFSDGVPVGKGIFSSRILSELWPFGFASFGGVSYDSAAYVAGYICKKITGEKADSHYARVDVRTGEVVRCVPEFARMSLKPGIGYSWFKKYWREVYGPRDGVVKKGGQVVPAPRTYDLWLSRLGESESDLLDALKDARFKRALCFKDDSTRARLEVRERCAAAKQRFLSRRDL